MALAYRTQTSRSQPHSGHQTARHSCDRHAQVMDRSQLPALTSTTMLVQAALSTPISARAKRSVGARNTVLIFGILTMVAANAAFALIPAVWGG